MLSQPSSSREEATDINEQVWLADHTLKILDLYKQKLELTKCGLNLLLWSHDPWMGYKALEEGTIYK